jgi:[ribosomal protein S5]-alanine N-acetyltransferase
VSPEVHLKGEKVRLESFTEADLTDDYIQWLNDPEVVRFSNQRFLTHDRDSCHAFLRSFKDSPNLFLSVKTLAGRPIGTMTAYRSLPHGTADIGIMIGDRGVWGGGYGQDAWNTLMRWLLEQPGIRKVTAGTLACNLGMLRLMTRSGMVLEGVRRAQELVEGEPQDIMLYAKFAE